MDRIIYIPGMNPKPAPAIHHGLLWRCLLEGVRRADPAAAEILKARPEMFQLTDWNFDYYREYRDVSDIAPAVELLLQQESATQADRYEADHWHRKLTRFVYWLIDLVPAIIPYIPDEKVRATVKETCAYFSRCRPSDENGISGLQVRARLLQQLNAAFANNERILLIGHSLGSVIAYDTLWELTHHYQARGKVDLFLTLGSPLGLNYVRRSLQGHSASGEARYPHNIRRWINLASVGDLTAIDARLQDDFQEMKHLSLIEEISDNEQPIYNFYRDADGLNVHRSYGYLVNPAVGGVIAQWIRGEH